MTAQLFVAVCTSLLITGALLWTWIAGRSWPPTAIFVVAMLVVGVAFMAFL